jgi:hypothetical protein
MNTLSQTLFIPIDNSFLVVFRACFGFLITAEAWGAILTGWVKGAFIDPKFTFPFIDFQWLQPLPGDGMYYYFFLMGCFGIAVMLGYKYRLAIVGYTILWTAVYLMQKTNYNNHYYLLVLLGIVMSLMPAHRNFSLDAKMNPEMKRNFCPNWCRIIFILQIGIVYTYGGIAKLNADWLSTDAIATILLSKKNFWMVGDILQEKWMHWFIAIGGACFDLFITPLLLWKKTRKWAFIASVFFHLFNSAIFQVGIFPFMGIAMCIFFFPPEAIKNLFFKKSETTIPIENYAIKTGFVGLMILWFVIQLVLPSRHWLFNSNVHWTEEGHRLSWRMMLRSKSGYANFKVVDVATGKEEMITQGDYLTAKQKRAVATKPDMCWQFVQILKEDYANKGQNDIEIYVTGEVGINGKKRQPFYDEEVDLAKVEWHRFKTSDWLLPYNEEADDAKIPSFH